MPLFNPQVGGGVSQLPTITTPPASPPRKRKPKAAPTRGK